MKMKNRYINILFMSFALTMFSCQDILDKEPAQSLSVEESLADYESLVTALLGAYDGLQVTNYYGRNYLVNPEIGGDNVYLTIDNSNRFVANYRYDLDPNTTQTGFWNQAYSIILRVNNIILAVDNVPDGTQAEKDQVMGEALTIRALAHFDLSRVFSAPYAEGTGADTGIPIMLEPNIGTPPRNTLSEVYDRIKLDLTQAIGLLNEDVGPFRITANAAKALLARVYLYEGDNANAEAMATDVINNGGYSLHDGTDLAFFYSTSGNDEEIFSLNQRPEETRGSNNLGQIYNPSGYGDIRVTTDIINMYEAGDERGLSPPSGADLIYLNSDGEYYNGKFLGESGVPGLTSFKILRLAEMYLIRAEARAKTSDFAGATSDVNVIRNRAGLADFSGTVTLQDVLDEKNREFAFEGHRTFDLWRNGLPLVRIQANTGLEVSAPAFIAANSFLRVYPIPQRELDTNPEITQAPGY
jgi:starch-binding outer membrane protein, SusD/RagB family